MNFPVQVRSISQETVNLPGADIKLFFNVLGYQWAASAFKEIKTTTPWRQGIVQLFGRKILSPRLSAWYGDKSYTYSKATWPAAPWPPALNAIKVRIEKVSGSQFNGALLHLYRDGRDSMGWHSDNEAEMGSMPIIASLSLGYERKFLFRGLNNLKHRNSMPLPDDSLLVMSGDTQANWQHSLPKTKKSIGSRINITFRWIID